MDYSKEAWARGCPNADCRQAPTGGLTFYLIPANLGDDSAGSRVKPINGAYANAIVKYQTNDHVYIYDQNGIPVKVRG